MGAKKVLVVDDHPVVRQGLRRMLEMEGDFQVVGEAASGEEALSLATTLAPDVVLLDIRMPGMDGLEAIRRLKKIRPDLKVIVLTFYGEQYLAEALEAGASGYLIKDMSQEELIQALKGAEQGRLPLAPQLVSRLVNEFATLVQGKGAKRATLTRRQREILRLVASGATNAQIADQLFVSLATVKRDLNHIFLYFDVADRSAAVAEALRRQLL